MSSIRIFLILINSEQSITFFYEAKKTPILASDIIAFLKSKNLNWTKITLSFPSELEISETESLELDNNSTIFFKADSFAQPLQPSVQSIPPFQSSQSSQSSQDRRDFVESIKSPSTINTDHSKEAVLRKYFMPGKLSRHISLINAKKNLYSNEEIPQSFLDLGNQLFIHSHTMGYPDKKNIGYLKRINNETVNYSETALSSIMASLLSTYFNGEGLLVSHQLPCFPAESGSSAMDIVISRYLFDEKQHGIFPLVIFETSVSINSKEKQLQGYILNIDKLQAKRPWIVLGITYCFSNMKIVVTAFYKGFIEGTPKIGNVKLFSKELCYQNDIARVFYSIAKFIDDIGNHGQFFRPNISNHIDMENLRNTLRHHSFIYKIYQMPTSYYYNYQMNLQNIANSELYFQVEDEVLVIKYPFIEGNHEPKTISQFVQILEQLDQLHQNNQVHGDIRASNMIFPSDSSQIASLIDFDLGGTEGVAIYQEGYQHSVDDVTRHPDAHHGNTLQRSHDLFALASLLAKCSVREQDQETWNQCIRKLQERNCNVRDVIQSLNSIQQSCNTLHLNVKFPESGLGTGSPPKNRKRPLPSDA